MSLLRFIARSLIAGTYIVDGINKVTKPAESAAEAEAFTEKVTPLVQRVAPAGYSSWVPENSETWVRIGGVAQIAGGAMFATGIGRRLGALLLAKASVLNIAIALPAKDATKLEKQAARPEVLTRVALLGSTLLATQDLQGNPSLSWRAGHTMDKVEKQASDTTEKLSRKAKKAARKARKQANKLAKSTRKSLESVVS